LSQGEIRKEKDRGKEKEETGYNILLFLRLYRLL